MERNQNKSHFTSFWGFSLFCKNIVKMFLYLIYSTNLHTCRINNKQTKAPSNKKKFSEIKNQDWLTKRTCVPVVLWPAIRPSAHSLTSARNEPETHSNIPLPKLSFFFNKNNIFALNTPERWKSIQLQYFRTKGKPSLLLLS